MCPNLVDLDQLAVRESEQTEWKKGVADSDDVIRTLSAFANDLLNLGGGYVVCGAEETKDRHGFQKLERLGLTAGRIKEVENQVLAGCRDRVRPSVTPLVVELRAATADRRILVFIQPATSVSHTFRDARGERHYVRVGRETREARNGILRDLLVRKGTIEPWDRRPCAEATDRDLDLLAVRDALNRMRVDYENIGIERYLSEDLQLSPFIPPLCAREPLTGVLRPRNFAMLLFGRDVQRFIPGAHSIFSVYPGGDRSAAHAERHMLAGTLIDQAQRLRDLVKAQATTVFDKYDSDAPNALKYPERALEEAVGNALAHRDYEQLDPTRVTAFADRVEVVSPGPLPLGVDPAAFRKGKSGPKWRNQTLAWLFTRLQFAQAEGQGVPTILRTMRAEGCPAPIWHATKAQVSCTLPAHPRHSLMRGGLREAEDLGFTSLSEARDRIHSMLARNPADPEGLRLLADMQHKLGDPKPLFDHLQLIGSAADKLPIPLLIQFGTALLSGNSSNKSYRQRAQRFLRIVAEAS